MNELDACDESKHFCDKEYFVEETPSEGSCETLVHDIPLVFNLLDICLLTPLT